MIVHQGVFVVMGCFVLLFEEETVDGAVDEVGNAELVAEDTEVSRAVDAVGWEVGDFAGFEAEITDLSAVAPVGEEEERVVGRESKSVVLSRSGGEVTDVGWVGDVVENVEHVVKTWLTVGVEGGYIEVASFKTESVGSWDLDVGTEGVDVDVVGVLDGEDIDASGVGNGGKEGAAGVDDEVVDHEVFFWEEDGLRLLLEVAEVVDHDGVGGADEEVVLEDAHAAWSC